MNPTPCPTPRLIAPLALSLLVACGGGGDSAAAPTPPSPPAPPPPPNTAAVVLEERVLNASDGQPQALSNLRALLPICNQFRALKNLPAQEPDPAALAGAERVQVRKYFSENRAATYRRSPQLVLVDFERFQQESRTLADPLPPDCSRVELRHAETATLWVDGVVWTLSHAQKSATGVRRATDFERRDLLADPAFPRPTGLVSLPGIGNCQQTPVGGSEAAGASGSSCYWDRFPLVAYLNLPWSLKGESTALGLRILTEPVSVESGRPLDPRLFEVPADFSRRGPN